MVIFHTIWTDGRLHVWGEQVAQPDENGVRLQTLGHDELRYRAGDIWDSLLVSGAELALIRLRLPSLNGVPLPSDVMPPTQADAQITLEPTGIPTLSFSPPDALDLLGGTPVFGREDAAGGASYLYWSRVALLVLELLAKQRFVPAMHQAGAHQHRGFWRVVVDGGASSDALRDLIASMPPVCRAIDTLPQPVQAAALVENFLWTAVDSQVRRCLEGDELAHAIQERDEADCTPPMLWLRALVSDNPWLGGDVHTRTRVHDAVSTWVAKLEPADGGATCRTCFRLDAPELPDPTGSSDETDDQRPWRLSLHLEATTNPGLVLDAAKLWDDRGDDPMILRRPFYHAKDKFLEDVAHAAKFFPPLSACVDTPGTTELGLSLEDTYRFLRDAAPVLELEGMGVWLPRWWRDDRPRLRMRLDLRPPAAARGSTADAGIKLDALVSYDWRIALGDDELSAEEISQLAAAKEPLIRLRDRWVELQPADVGAAIRFLDNHPGGQITLFEALRQCYMADDLDTGLPVEGLRAHGWVEELLTAGGLAERMIDVEPPDGFVGSLRPYQLTGLAWFRFLSRHGLGACLADDMGLGKTIQMIALWLHERECGAVNPPAASTDDAEEQGEQDEQPGPTLLVVPMSLVGNWEREIRRFAPTLRVMVHHGLERLSGKAFIEQAAEHDVVISTYGLTHRDHEYLTAVNWYRITLDEAQNIKNPAAKQSQAVRSLSAVHRVALTGTPVENHLSELWSIVDFLNPGYLGSATDFRRRFAVPIERYHDAERAGRLRQLVRPFLLRRRKSDPDILNELPDKLEMKVFCNLVREQAALYEAIVGDMMGQIEQSGGIQRRGLILATLVKLKQVCNHPVNYLGDGSTLPRRSGKCDRLTEMLEEIIAEGHKALVFTQFRQMGELLQSLITETLGVDVLFLHGGSSKKKRDEMIDEFQTAGARTPVFLLSLKAGGVGLNLTAANHVFHFDRWWNPAVEDQATDRAHRIGQSKQVQVHKFICAGTMEERIDSLIENKRALAENIVGGGEDWLTELSTDALRELFALSRDAVAEE